MSRFYLLIFSSFFLVSCFSVNVRYLGSASTPTSQVDVYVDPATIKKPYTIIGKGYPEYGLYAQGELERMQEKAIQKARDKGADAILFQDVYLVNDGTPPASTVITDSLGRVSIPFGHASVAPLVTGSKVILFLKYN